MILKSIYSILLSVSFFGCSSRTGQIVVLNAKPEFIHEKYEDDIFSMNQHFLVLPDDWKVEWGSGFPELLNETYTFTIVSRPDWECFAYRDYGSTIPSGYLREISKNGHTIWIHPHINRFEKELNNGMDPTVKTPVESGNVQGTAGHP